MTFPQFCAMVACLKRENLKVSGFFLSRHDYEELFQSTKNCLGTGETIHPVPDTRLPYIPDRCQILGYRVEPTNQ